MAADAIGVWMSLSRGAFFALVSREDYDAAMSDGPWSRHVPSAGREYAIRWARSRLYLHRFIARRMGLSGAKMVDHVNNNGLDNRRSNLRSATSGENSRNRALNRNSTSGFKGVTWKPAENRWRAQIRFDGKKLRLGAFMNAEDAARAYDAAALRLHGEFAATNVSLGLLPKERP